MLRKNGLMFLALFAFFSFSPDEQSKILIIVLDKATEKPLTDFELVHEIYNPAIEEYYVSEKSFSANKNQCDMNVGFGKHKIHILKSGCQSKTRVVILDEKNPIDTLRVKLDCLNLDPVRR